METKLETSAKGFHCFESEKLSLLTNYYSTEIPKFQDVRAFLRFTNRPGIKGIGIWCAVIIAILVLFFSDISNVEFAFTGHIAFWTPGMDCPKGNQQKMLISKLRFAKIYHDSGRANRLPCHLRELRYT